MATKYKREDILPIVLCVLNFMQQDLVNAAFFYAVEKHYPDLKGLLSYDDLEPDAAVCGLLSAKDDDKVIVHMIKYLGDIHKELARFINIYNVAIDEIFADERITIMAEEFYWLLVSFPDRPKDVDDAILNLQYYTESIVYILHYLCKLVLFEVIDIDCAFNDDIYNSFLTDLFNPSANDGELAETILFELMLKFNTYNEDLDLYD